VGGEITGSARAWKTRHKTNTGRNASAKGSQKVRIHRKKGTGKKGQSLGSIGKTRLTKKKKTTGRPEESNVNQK